ncbi:laccase [Lentinula boryana]|uniref:Laccase n=1 Tax=Lentinula boryana TaxID=40481 RepID=A0ABQ8Q9A7_9AGAR|nr:laccase [Lentinula boryana]
MRLFLSSLAIHLIYVQALDIIRNNGVLQIVNKDLSPDGFSRPTVLAGINADSATFPGPLIQGNKGDRFDINVVDSLTDPSMNRTTSIHWHGLFQEHTNWADGPSFVTQCPIAPDHSFLYSFSVPDQAGTYWYHSHLGVQYCDGLRGPFVVYDPNDPQAHMYDVDDESTVITLADWYHPKGFQVLAHGAAVSNATLINGQGRYPGGPDASLAVINVQAGKRYRFRLVSMSCDPNYLFSIDGHNLTVIEADGVSTTPVTVNQIQIYAAQRYSFVLTADQPVGNYWIRANPNTPLFGSQASAPFANGTNSAILRYNGAPNTDPVTAAPPASGVVGINEHLIHPLQNPGAPGKPYPGGATVINMTLGFNAGAFTINNYSFVSPSVPVLLQILSGTQKAQNLLPKGSVYGLQRDQVYEINLIGGTAPGGPHPFHLHGHNFDVIKSFDSPEYNFQNPARRDTTPVAAGQMTTIRFVTDNPGPWFLHCHIDFHLAAGLAVVMAEDISDVKLNDPVPPEWDALCPIYNNLQPDQL